MLTTKLENLLPTPQCPTSPYNLARKRTYRALLLPGILGSIKTGKPTQRLIG